MWRNAYGRRVLIQWPRAATELAARAAERDSLREELDRIRADRDALRVALQDLLDAVRARRNAEAELAALYRERDIARARAAERDPAQPLH
jgi:hypothetical protein